MSWIPIEEELYFTIFHKYDKELAVFGACTHLENDSRFNAHILTEWGFRWSEHPLIKRDLKPDSQVLPGKHTDWPVKFFLFVQDKDPQDDTD